MRIRNMGMWALALSAGFAATEPAAAAGCTNASFEGTYGVQSTGSNSTGQPNAGLYQMTADGAGNITAIGQQSAGGTIQAVNVSGAYEIGKTCTGTITFGSPPSAATHLNIALDAANSEFQLIRTDSGWTQTGEGFALGVGICGLSGKVATYAKSVSGHNVGSVKEPVAIVGRLILDGKGNASATDTFSENGVVATRKLKGTYTANSDCTGTAQIKANGTTYNFAALAVSAGKKLLLLETDANTVISGKATKQ